MLHRQLKAFLVVLTLLLVFSIDRKNNNRDGWTVLQSQWKACDKWLPTVPVMKYLWTSQSIYSKWIMMYFVVLCDHVLFYCVVFFVLFCVVFCCFVICCSVLFMCVDFSFVTLCCVLFCCVAFSFVTLCIILLCCVLFCCVVFYFVVLCFVAYWTQLFSWRSLLVYL